ncbi:Uncharacterized conserved protein YjiS, DUF1127 family [Cognatiyoonia sediminum]|uniref:Uncharacterized conserved protein YjiS, DUF1127 family n=1 Tax=Cognatiyoonia sediminum TaxID=1508389 RepID=A0A1M5NDK1_9RHOB|nr:DUF1127 domain-containing protein [Cognatiyoonia sediminum]SHG87654.1 Uncharacterized conserved protein YjiS, DUF1127 family [Cognatiyoonia sediminum]
MAAFDTNRTVNVMSAGRVTRAVADAFGSVIAWNDARVTRNALNKLSARELEDIGLVRGDIDNIANRRF